MSLRTLPSRPTPRSRSVGGNGDEAYYESPARAQLPSGPRPTSSRSSRTPNSTSFRSTEGRATTSASGSSFLDRMKSSRGGETSSRTSLGDDRDEQSKPGRRWAPAQGRRPETTRTDEFDRNGYQDSDSAKQPAGHGSDLWSRVTAVAGSLTVNVSKAWENGIGSVDGEETPPGEESRLTKAMKAYHLERARSPADLPAWLFDEHERGAAPRSWSISKRDGYEERLQPEPTEKRQKSSLRDVYDKAGATSLPANNYRREPEVSGAANRLKMMREGKRSLAQARSEPEAPVEGLRQGSRNSEERPSQTPKARTAPLGLPSGPGRARRG